MQWDEVQSFIVCGTESTDVQYDTNCVFSGSINKRNDNSPMSAIKINSVVVSGRENVCAKKRKTLSLLNNIQTVSSVQRITRSDEMKMMAPAAGDQMSQ